MDFTLNELHELKDYFHKVLLYANEDCTTVEDETLTEYGRNVKESTIRISEIEQEINNNPLYTRFAKTILCKESPFVNYKDMFLLNNFNNSMIILRDAANSMILEIQEE